MNGQTATHKPTVVVTGCSGLLGTHVMNALKDRYAIVGMDIKPPDAMPSGGHFLRCDLTDDKSVDEALGELRSASGGELASVIHLAAYYDFSGEPSALYEELTVKGTRRLLRGLHDFNVEQFVFSSTLLVMRPSDDGTPIDETSPTEGTWDYPESKLRTEEVIAEERRGIPSVILRIAGVYDEYGRSPAITEHVKRIYDKSITSYFFPGNRSHGQAFVHMDDTIDSFTRVVDQRKSLNGLQTFLIAEPEPTSYADLQEILGEAIHGKEWPTIRVPKAVAKAGAWTQEKVSAEGDEPFIKPWMVDMADAHYPVDIGRARERLGWSPSHKLAETLPEIVAKLFESPKRWCDENGIEPPEKALEEQTSWQAHP